MNISLVKQKCCTRHIWDLLKVDGNTPWMNSKVTKAIRKRNRLLKLFCRRTKELRLCKGRYFANLNEKLQDTKIGPKRCWGIVKSLYGNKIQSTIPTLLEGDSLITDTKEKATLFNDYFSTQCKVEQFT